MEWLRLLVVEFAYKVRIVNIFVVDRYLIVYVPIKISR